MTRFRLIGTAFAASMIVAAVPVVAQTGHDAGHATTGHATSGQAAGGHGNAGHTMSDADKKKMESCKGMSHDAAAKDAQCAALMKAHPDVSQHGSATTGH